jgi:hypothetical protein
VKAEVAPRRHRLRRGLAALVVVGTLALLVYSVYAERRTALLVIGDPSPQAYVTPVDLLVPDRITTERERQLAREQVPTIYSVDPTLQQVVLGSFSGSGCRRPASTCWRSATAGRRACAASSWRA